MRQQYHIRKVANDTHIWDVNKLILLTANLQVTEIPVAQIKELNEAYWHQETMTCKDIALHAKLIFDSDLNFPILLCPERKMIDGMHRVCKAYIEGKSTVAALVLDHLPPPDYINVKLEDLPY